MNKSKRTIWVVIGGSGVLVGWRALRHGVDPIPQWAGLGAAGVILLFLAEPAPKLASGFATLLGISLALNWDYGIQTSKVSNPGNVPVTTVTTPGENSPGGSYGAR